MNETKHTPRLPWIVDATPSVAPCWFHIRAKAEKCDAWIPVADCSGHLNAAENAQFIVRAVNTIDQITAQRDALLAACKGLVECIAPKWKETVAKHGMDALQSDIRRAVDAIALCEKEGK